MGTPVRVVNEPVEAAWIGNQLFVEVHPSEQQAYALDTGEEVLPIPPTDLLARVGAAAGAYADRVDWDAVKKAGLEPTGIPTPVLTVAGPLVAENPAPEMR